MTAGIVRVIDATDYLTINPIIKLLKFALNAILVTSLCHKNVYY